MSITAATGFQATGIAAGLKEGKRDLALVRNLGPSRAAAAVFTSNRFAAAPVQWTREVLADGSCAAVLLNSGGANACTGPAGLADTRASAEAVAEALDVASDDIGVCSTGLIGIRLPMPEVLAGITTCVEQLSTDGGHHAAEAIMTTDTHPKEAVRHQDGWTVGGMAKGAGMLAPGLATMLVVITTDVDLPADQLDAALRAATRVTFDRVDSDGCMSTNDTVLLLASGASGEQPPVDTFTTALTEVCHDLAMQLLRDAEGAAHDIAVEVTGAATEDEAVDVARTITRSNLFKTAIFGQDPNWGRALSAIGTTAATFEPDRVDVSFNGVMVCRGGGIGDPRELVDLSSRDVQVVVDLHAGDQTATVWTNDLTYDYVKENAEYSS